MKKDQKWLHIIEKFQEMDASLKGVWMVADLCNLVRGGSPLNNIRAIKHLLSLGLIQKIQRGCYISKNANLVTLACRLNPQSYVSMEVILSEHNLIGSTPKNIVSMIHLGRAKKVKTPIGFIQYFSTQKTLWFGFSKNSEGCLIAEPEKAFLDMLYYYTHGVRFVVDPLSEVDVSGLNQKKLKNYLGKYKNPKFRKFVLNILETPYE